MAKLKSLHIGFIAIVDCAPLVAARELGFATDEGLSIHLHREVSWANVRDKLNAGMFDCAHMLAPMPLAATLGIAQIKEAMIAPLTLSLNGSAITVSNELYAQMMEIDPDNTEKGGRAAAWALAKVIRAREANGGAPLTLGTVYPFSCHTYELRDWLAGGGIDPDSDVRIVVLPPSLMTRSLEAGQIQGFCAGEPWNSESVERDAGAIVATKRDVWGLAPEKVLGVRAEWASENADTLDALIRVLMRTASWLDLAANRRQIADHMARSEYLGVSSDVVMRALTGAVVRRKGQEADGDDRFVVFSREGANQPSISHAVWLLTQMARWGEIGPDVDLIGVARQVFRPDILAKATGRDYAGSSRIDEAVEAAAGFAPATLAQYLRSIRISSDHDLLRSLALMQGKVQD